MSSAKWKERQKEVLFDFSQSEEERAVLKTEIREKSDETMEGRGQKERRLQETVSRV